MVVTDTDRAAVEALLERFRDAWARLDAEAALACFENDPGTVVIGTDAAEFWRGYERLVQPFQAMTDLFANPAYAWGAGEPTVEVMGTSAWAAGVLHAAFDTADGRIEIPMRTSVVMRRHADGTWLIRHAHFSVAAETVDY